MTSILTNSAARTALQVLQNTQANLTQTQNRISTGKRVITAADNAAYFSIASQLDGDSSTLSTVSDALALGAATIDTATNGINQAISVVQQIRDKIVSAKSPGVDKSKVQADIAQLQAQLKTIADSASFNGQNFLSVDSGVAGYSATKAIVASFSRSPAGAVNIGTIDIDTSAIALYDANTTTWGGAGALGVPATINSHVATTLTALTASAAPGSTIVPAGITGATALRTSASASAGTLTLNSYTSDSVAAGNYYANTITLSGVNFSASTPVVSVAVSAPQAALDAGDTLGSVSTARASTYDASTKTLTFQVAVRDTTNSAQFAYHTFTISNFVGVGGGGIIDTAQTVGTNSLQLSTLNITALPGTATLDDATTLTDNILKSLATASSNLGSNKARVSLQQSFVTSLKDSIDTGVGALVDADLNQESTRLQALQTQQQLGVQALSIANQSTQSILSLFRGA